MPLTKINLKWTEARYWVCCGSQSACPSLSLNVAEPHSCQELSPAFFNQMGLRAPSTPCLGVSKPGSRASKAPHLRIPVRQIFTSPSFLVWVTPDLVLQVSKAAGWDYYLDSVGRNSICQDSSARCCKSLPTSLSQSDARGFSPQISRWSPLCEIRRGAPTKPPTMLGEVGCLTRFSFPTGEARGSGQTSMQCCNGPGQAMGSIRSCSSYPSREAWLALVMQGVLQSHPRFYHSLSGTLFLNRCQLFSCTQWSQEWPTWPSW